MGANSAASPRGARDELAVRRIAEQSSRLLRGDPTQLVHLATRREPSVLKHRHQPPAHVLRTPADLVPGGRQLVAELAAHAALLLDLPQRGLLPGLAGVELAFRQRPV